MVDEDDDELAFVEGKSSSVNPEGKYIYSQIEIVSPTEIK
jgi:hypothetical protein